MRKIILLAAVLAAIPLAACEETARSKQAEHGAVVAEQAMSHSKTNAEIDNIGERLRLTSNPNLLGHIAIVNKVGQVVLYTTIKGKVTSGSKRLTNPTYCPSVTGECPSDEGTFGSSNPYIYFWTTQGQYVQTSMDYIYSDQPLRLEERPMMVLPTTPDTTPAGK